MSIGSFILLDFLTIRCPEFALTLAQKMRVRVGDIKLCKSSYNSTFWKGHRFI